MILGTDGEFSAGQTLKNVSVILVCALAFSIPDFAARETAGTVYADGEDTSVIRTKK